MKTSLKIPPNGGLDFLALGALVHRLDPGVIPFQKATVCHIYTSGGEYNVAANLSDCFRLQTGIVTAMVDYPIGELIANGVRAMGVKPFYKWFSHNGVTGPNMATVYSDRGQGARGPVVFYNRANEAAAQLKPGDFDWNGIYSMGIRWFHSGGIFAALSEIASELIIEGMNAAKAHGSVVSFDINYRPKLWNIWSDNQRVNKILNSIVENVDVLIAGEDDLQFRLGISDSIVDKKHSLDPCRFFKMSNEVVKRYPQIKVIATTLREVHSTNHHSWCAAAWIDGDGYISPTCELDILDRIGSGDGFAAGFFYGLLAEEGPQEAVNMGWAHGALITTFPGDQTMASLAEVRAFAQGGSSRVQR
jgi:2-dehydro-3-deoxygluconokinase